MKGYIPPLAFALLIVLLIILVIAFVPQVRDAILQMIGAWKGTPAPTPLP